MTSDGKIKVLVCSDRVGYGHIRGMLAISDMFEKEYSDKIITEIGIFSDLSSAKYREKWQMINEGLNFVYAHLSDFNLNQNPVDMLNYFDTAWEWLAKADDGVFEAAIRKNRFDLTIGAHPAICALLPNDPGIMIGLDPYPPLYFCRNKNIITTAVDGPSLRGFNKLGAHDARETGAMIPYAVIQARKNAMARIAEVRNGDPIIVSILTGGSLTHGQQITELTAALQRQTNEQDVKKIYVVVGNSKQMLETVTKVAMGDKRVEIVYDEDQIRLVRRADETLGKADIVIAKTGEIPQCIIPGGKAFKTFHYKPALGPQEIALREYPQELSRVNGLSALEIGIEPELEVARILKQKADGTLAHMMENGLRVPEYGTKNLAKIVLEMRDKLLAETKHE